MTIFLAVFIPIAILGFLYLFIIENNGLPDWMERVSRNSSSLWTYGIIIIGLIGILRYLFR